MKHRAKEGKRERIHALFQLIYIIVGWNMIRLHDSWQRTKCLTSYLCINARIKSFPVIISKPGTDDGGVKQSH
jgi:hypothetical protein